ncbi:aldo/keto reductase [Ancylobacter sp. 6x-1]|uniref:Aldo/keto reductase n=1 Tax=Ancylobacter crimeensis TaxID=2579147 RepID=A0ABT0DBA5_9HYPH|nr:aldo/keto reductase [Ancylobacter crimeensis]MCK0197234.1 aldo/keto reductase [Ancylobacter crimeensis]
MKYRTLGRSGLKVSALSMGTFSFGGVGDFAMVARQGVAEARRLVDVCLDGGINVFDTANMYSLGRSEEILGEVLEGRRERVLISSKARMRIGEGPNDEGASRFHLIRECERSLKRLRTDHIDIYFLHEWDGTTPLEETLSALDALMRAGKIRYIGCSNFSGWHIMKALGVAEQKGLPRFVTQQIHYTLEAREAEYELLPIAIDQGVDVMVWSPLAAGLLSGAFTRDRVPADSRQAAGWSEPPIRDRERLWAIVDVLTDIAGARGATPAQIALAWTLTRPGIASLVVGGTEERHFRDNIAAAAIELTSEELDRLNRVSRPAYIYPYWHQHNFAADRFGAGDLALHGAYEDLGKI